VGKRIIGASARATNSTPLAAVRHLTVDEDAAGQRLDNFLLRLLKGVPKTHVYRVIRSGEVRVNKARAAADTRLEIGDDVRLPGSGVDPDQTLVVKGGLLEGTTLNADEVRRLADIEPREVLLARLAGLMAAPMTQFAGLLQALPRNFAYGLKALIDQGGAAAAPAAPGPADDTPVDTVADEAAPADEASEPTPEPAETPADDAAQNENNEDGDN